MRKRLLIALAVLAAGYEVVSLIVDSFTPGPGGATSSSYATSSDGLAAYAEVLQRSGRGVTQLRGKLEDAQLDSRSTVIALDPNTLTTGEVKTLKAFVSAGGRLVAGGANPARWLRLLLVDPPRWSSEGLPEVARVASAARGGATAGLQGVSRVVTGSQGSFTSKGQTTPLLGSGASSLLTSTSLGRGQVELLADPSPLHNAHLDQADNAALGDRLAGAPGRRVTFLEGIHGYGTGTGLAGLPTRWKWALVGLLLAAAAWVAARFRRLGEPEPGPGVPIPPRRAHVEALASALERSRRPAAAAAPVVSHARDRVMARSMLPADAQDNAIMDAARKLGLDEAEAQAVVRGAGSGSETDLLAAGRALARLI